MAFNKRTWKGRQGTGLNKFSIDGATPVTVVNQPDSITEQGDALSAGNLNDLENRINNAFEEIADGTQVVGKATADASGNVITDTYETKAEASDLNDALTQLDHRVENLEQAKGDYVVSNYKDGSITPSGKGNWAVVEGLRGVSRVRNILVKNGQFNGTTDWTVVSGKSTLTASNNIGTITASVAQAYMQVQARTSINVVAGHSYLVCAKMRMSSTARVKCACDGFTSAPIDITPTANTWYTQTAIVTGASTGSYNLAFGWEGTPSVGDKIEVADVIVTDLTLYFGGTIPSDADTIAEIQTNYPHLLTPSEYGVRIVDSSYSGVRAVGKNLVSGYIAQEGFWNTDGWQATSGIKSSVKIPVRAGATYIGSFYDKQGNRINDLVYTPFVNEDDAKPTRLVTTSTITLTGNEKYLAVRNYSPQSSYITADNYAYQLEEGSSATAFSAYQTNTLSLTFQGKSAGSVYDQLETNAEIVQEIDGEKVTIYKKRETQRIGTYTFTGNETWNSWGGGIYYCNELQNLIKPAPSNTSPHPGLISDSSLEVVGASYVSSGGIGVSTGGAFVCADTNRSLLTGKTIFYEKRTSVVTLSDPLIDNTLLTESGGRMATVQTGTVVDGSFDMGFINL